MIKLQEGQNRMVVPYKDDFYFCVVNEENQLVSFETLRHIKKDREGNFYVDVEMLRDNLNYLMNYEISHFGGISHPYRFKEAVQDLKSLQHIIHDLEWIVEFDKYRGNYEIAEKLDGFVKALTPKVEFMENIYKEKIVPQIPKNWPYAMFPEPGWGEWQHNVDLFNFACGKTDFAVEEIAVNNKNSYYKKDFGNLNGIIQSLNLTE